MAFGKRRRAARAAEEEEETEDSVTLSADGGSENDPAEAAPETAPGASAPPRTFGPWDSSEVDKDDGIERVDVGAMRLPTVPGVDLRVDVSPQGRVTGLRFAGAGSEMQLGAFAAPRTAGIWEQVRQEVRESLSAQGGEASDDEGPWGAELVAVLPTPNGRVPGRFVGVDGPRWFLRALIVGKAARDEQAADPFEEVLRGLVVSRGEEAMPVREAIPIVLPEDMMAQVTAQMKAQAEQSGASGPDGGSTSRPGQG